MATRSELRKEFRTLLNEVGTSWINDTTDSALLTINDLLWQAYKHVSKELECFTLHNLGVETIADQEFYEFGAFGYHAADLDMLTVSEAANNTSDMVLAYAVAISLKNETGGVSTGNNATYTVAGTDEDGTSISEAVVFTRAADLTNVADDGVVTKSTTTLFATVTSVTCSAAQPTDWKRYAGIAGELEKIVDSEAADNTTTMIPPTVYVPEWRIAISITNETGAPATGTTATYTVNGRNWAGKTISEGLTFDATVAYASGGLLTVPSNGVDGIVTKYTSKLFATVTSISCSAAQPSALWKRYAGVPETTLGDRVFKPVCLHYDDDELVRLTRGRVLGSNRSFRGLTSDTPGNWTLDTEKVFRMVPATTAGEDLYLDGFAYPDSETFDEDTHEPAIDLDDQSLIPLWAAILTTIRDPETPNDARGSVFWPRWSSELAAAKARRRDTGSAEIEIGRYAFYRKHSHRVDEDELTLA